jgi:hypothetical protein
MVIMLGADACLPLTCNYLHTLHYLDTLILQKTFLKFDNTEAPLLLENFSKI